ncbi:NAD(P)-dependent oxidoreductase [Curtobacterium sp. MCPF17_002]|uniref:NAD(P)-dependent oxidoreductase n=1 Tax=Curtobacterium sp. MCPF17_002 TaxID=2175645 RepID=UPI0011B3E068|nr:NAD(P)-dependent oxidoreductase [Curtobacterium sp. MCPF17_002]WIB77976.1 NAD(P)-dependent oxidoreductase [Curtobacterium sp. MCPF17_002]
MVKTGTGDDGPPVLGVAGIGRMGTPIAGLLSRHFRLGAFDVIPARRDAVTGSQWHPSLTALADASDVLVTVLPGPGEVRTCMLETLPALRPGSLWLDLTSGDPNLTAQLADEAERRNVAVVSAPMGGSVAEAAAGNLVFYVSGHDDAVERAAPILETLSGPDGVHRAGTRAEDGQIVKLLANGLWFANALAASEAMLIGQALGLGAAGLHKLLRDSAGGSRFLDDHLGRLLDGDYLTTFGIDRIVEELGTIHSMSRTANVATPMLDASARLHRAALERYGPELGELLAVKLLEEQAGRQLRN